MKVFREFVWKSVVVGVLAFVLASSLEFKTPVASATETVKAPVESSLTAASTDETLGTALGVARCRELAAYVDWNTGVTAGVVEIETADVQAYAGTWANLGTVTFSGTAPNQAIVQVTGIQQWVRARVSTAVANGTVDVPFICN